MPFQARQNKIVFADSLKKFTGTFYLLLPKKHFNAMMKEKEEVEKFISDGKIAFGLAVDSIDGTIPVLVEALLEHQK